MGHAIEVVEADVFPSNPFGCGCRKGFRCWACRRRSDKQEKKALVACLFEPTKCSEQERNRRVFERYAKGYAGVNRRAYGVEKDEDNIEWAAVGHNATHSFYLGLDRFGFLYKKALWMDGDEAKESKQAVSSDEIGYIGHF